MGKPTRRDFTKSAFAAGAALTIVPRHVLGRGYVAPSDKLNIACIGVGGMGKSDVAGVSGENLVAFADVDWDAAADSFRTYPNARKYRDWREMLAREGRNIDAVTVSTPDHSHAVAAMAALKAGKHVYCQKPLARLLGEVKALRGEAGRRPRQVTQMGNQGHAGDGVRLLREYVEGGVIGAVREVHYWTNRPIWPQGLIRPYQAYNPDPDLNWDLWLGPSPDRPYATDYAPFRWRGWWDFGTGALGDMACHGMDAAYWILDLGFPERIEVETSQLFQETAPRFSRITYTFPAKATRGTIRVVWRDGGLIPPRPAGLGDEEPWPTWDIGGQVWYGDEGAILSGMYAENPRVLNKEKDAALKATPPAVKYPRSKGVYAEWIEACKGTGETMSSFNGHAGGLTEMVLLGCLAVRAGKTLTIDPATGRITNVTLPPEWTEPVQYRRGYSL
jgi:predicted dehydrogenase